MRSYDGTLFPVEWGIVEDPSARTLQFAQPFVSGRNDIYNPFDTGIIGEIPNNFPDKSRYVVPLRGCAGCYAGVGTWWQAGWPADTPPVVLGPDGFPVECGPPQTGSYDCGYDYGYDSGGTCLGS